MSEQAEWVSIAAAAETAGLGASTLRRLAADGAVPARRGSRGWEVQAAGVEAYLLSRRPTGRPPESVAIRHEGPGRWRPGADAVGLRLLAHRPADQPRVTFEVWLSMELAIVLRSEGRDLVELVTAAAPSILEQLLLDLPPEAAVTPAATPLLKNLGSADRGWLLRAAGDVEDFAFLVGEAPRMSGVPSRYHYSRGDGAWVRGDHVVADRQASESADVVVEAKPTATGTLVTTVRVDQLPPACLRVDALQRAIAAYTAWREGEGLPPAGWVAAVEALVQTKLAGRA